MGGGKAGRGFVHTKKNCWQCVLWEQVFYPVVISFFPIVFFWGGNRVLFLLTVLFNLYSKDLMSFQKKKYKIERL